MQLQAYPRYLYFVLFFFLLGDLSISYWQYYHSSIDGDLIAIILPAPWYAEVLDDPIGIHTLASKKAIGGSGRNLAHLTLKTYFDTVPFLLQKIMSPVSSIYASAALFMLAMHLALIYLLAYMMSEIKNPFHLKNIWIMSILTCFIQFTTYYPVMGLIDKSITYVFFYIWPCLGLLYYYHHYFIFLKNSNCEKFTLTKKIVLLLLSFYLVFSGPLIPPVSILWNTLLIFFIGVSFYRKTQIQNFSTGYRSFFRSPQFTLILLLVLFNVFALYAYYLGKFNVENLTNNSLVSLTERYVLLLKGIWYFLTYKMGLSILLLAICINSVFIYNYQETLFYNYKILIFSVIIFSAFYLLLLPLGGYRSYRPLILRYDTFIPVMIGLLLIFIQGVYILSDYFKERPFLFYSLFIFALMAIYTLADYKCTDNRACEKRSLEKIMASGDEIVRLPAHCTIMSWEYIRHPEHSIYISQMLKKWNILAADKKFYQPAEE